MSATYNWAYKPGVSNKYGITIDASDDNVCPDNACYVALFGNDTTGNGSRQFPYRTITKAVSVNSQWIILGSGVYRETGVLSNMSSLIGDGDITIDISYNVYLCNLNANQSYQFYNIRFKGNNINSYVNQSFFVRSATYDCFFDGCYLNGVSGNSGSPGGDASSSHTNMIVSDFAGYVHISSASYYGIIPIVDKNCTYVNCNDIRFFDTDSRINSCLFYGCNISGDNTTLLLSYNLFYYCNFKLDGPAAGGVNYPNGTPSGFTYYEAIADLQAAYTAIYGTVGFANCLIANPLFNNINIGDYSLQFGSPAKNLSYFGTYVGARSVAYPVTVSATESAGGFDFSTIVNLSVSNNSITLVNPAQNGSIQTGLFANNSGRQLARLPVYGFNADRNGQYIDSISDLSGSVQQAGDTLTVPTPYLVETGSITYNGSVYQPGDRLTTVDGVTTFSSDFGGILREITEAPERHTIMMRCGNGGETVTAGAALTAGYWYYVISGSVTYSGTVYGGGQSFKASGSGGFSGSGNVITALGPEAYNHYEPGIQPTSNNEGDTRTGAIVRGNGDPAYVRGGYGVQEFPINARFIQLYYIINVANLKP